MFKVGDKVKILEIFRNNIWYTNKTLTILKCLSEVYYVSDFSFNQLNLIHECRLRHLSITETRKLKLEKIINL